MNKTLFKNIKVGSSKVPVDVLINDGFITSISPNLVVSNDVETVNCAGKVILPLFVDGHAHIDKTLWGMPWQENDVPGELSEIIKNERNFRANNEFDSFKQSSEILKTYLMKGTGHVRTHIDVDTEIGVKHVEGVLETKKKYKGYVGIETVCFPQSGLLVRKGTIDVMSDAMALGCDFVGGIDPSSFDRNPVKHLDSIFNLADKSGAGVDLHLHEPGDLGAFTVELLIERTKALSMQGKVTLSHGFCLGEVSPSYQAKLAKALGELDISVATTAPANRNVPPFDLLREHGVTISAGNDGIRDTWSPYGNGDMLQRAMFLGLKYRWRKDTELENALYSITEGGANMMSIDTYGIKVGAKANFVVIHSENFADAIMLQPLSRDVYIAGKRIASNGKLEIEL